MTEPVASPPVDPATPPVSPATPPIDSADLATAASPRDAIARAKGLPGATITGGDDPQLDAELERERPWVRLLVIMIVVIAVGGFVLGAVTALFGRLLGG